MHDHGDGRDDEQEVAHAVHGVEGESPEGPQQQHHQRQHQEHVRPPSWEIARLMDEKKPKRAELEMCRPGGSGPATGPGCSGGAERFLALGSLLEQREASRGQKRTVQPSSSAKPRSWTAAIISTRPSYLVDGARIAFSALAAVCRLTMRPPQPRAAPRTQLRPGRP